MFISNKQISSAIKFLQDNYSVIEEYSIKSQATADPTRVKILLLLYRYKKLCPSDIAKILDVTPSAVSHQMRVLEATKLVKKVKLGKIITYSLIQPNLFEELLAKE